MTGHTKNKRRKEKRRKSWHNGIVLYLNANSFPSTLILILIQWDFSPEAFSVCQFFTKADICCTM
jgi:hypothetical protein